jgi:cyclic pyranopterin phosphate synthase
MVDVGSKEPTKRVAVASGLVRMTKETLAAIIQRRTAKGDVLQVAQLAAIQAAKRTWELIPLCHPVALTKVEASVEPDEELPGVKIMVQVEGFDRTGFEMEALTAVSVAALTVYDMCKSMDRAMILSDIRLEFKSGGKSGTFKRE